ncbi:MAG TPA: helicase, partial [Streptomyces sp.]|nr:helicase [Streptomyces sp.]
MRDGLVTYIRRDLLGPWDGETETLPGASSGPRDRYLVGMLGPRPPATRSDEIALAAAQSADGESGDESQGDDSEPRDHLTPQAAGHIWASSMGLSFTVPASVGTLSVTARWGRYTQSEEATDQGTTRKVWSREPVEHPVDIDVTSTAGRTVPLEGAVVLDVQVRHHSAGSGEDLRTVELALVNGQEDSRDARDARWLFQAAVEVTAFPDDQAAVFLPVDDPLDPANRGHAPEDPEDRRLRLLYRDSLSHANGRNVAVHAQVRDGERNAHR